MAKIEDGMCLAIRTVHMVKEFRFAKIVELGLRMDWMATPFQLLKRMWQTPPIFSGQE